MSEGDEFATRISPLNNDRGRGKQDRTQRRGWHAKLAVVSPSFTINLFLTQTYVEHSGVYPLRLCLKNIYYKFKLP